MVELAYIAQQINSDEAICNKLVKPAEPGQKATITKDYTKLLGLINGASNLVMVEKDINKAKGTALAGIGNLIATGDTPESRKEKFSSLSKKTQVRRLDCSLSHGMTRLSFLTGGSCQLSN